MKLPQRIAAALWIALIFATASVNAEETQTDPGKREDIKKLLEVTGIHEQLPYMKDSLLNSYSQMIAFAYPKVPQEFWKEFDGLIGEREMKELEDRIVPVYDKNMDRETIKKLIEMFETPFWVEWRNKMPRISQEAGIIGSQWGQEISQSAAFKSKMEALVQKYELEKLNPRPETKPQPKPEN
ncbi:MAG: DUF2059 domain-containing protein [Nitrospinae bacterium]|nr:DUF2059 domain-containing protein [Nitrospinota bacterium]